MYVHTAHTHTHTHTHTPTHTHTIARHIAFDRTGVVQDIDAKRLARHSEL